MFDLTRCDQVSLRASCAFIISMTTSDRFYFLHKYYIKPKNVVKYSCVNITQKCNPSPFTVVDSGFLRPAPNPRGSTKLLFDQFLPKPHENKRNWGRGVRPLCPLKCASVLQCIIVLCNCNFCSGTSSVGTAKVAQLQLVHTASHPTNCNNRMSYDRSYIMYEVSIGATFSV